MCVCVLVSFPFREMPLMRWAFDGHRRSPLATGVCVLMVDGRGPDGGFFSTDI